MGAIVTIAERNARALKRRHDAIDIIVDFPPESERLARERAEEICSLHEVPADIEMMSWSSAKFLERIGPHAMVLG